MLMRVLPWLYAIPPDAIRWMLLGLTAVIVVWAGRSIYSSAARGLRHGATNMNTLVSLGTGVAFAYSAYATIWPAADRQVYFRRGPADSWLPVARQGSRGESKTPRPGCP